MPPLERQLCRHRRGRRHGWYEARGGAPRGRAGHRTAGTAARRRAPGARLRAPAPRRSPGRGTVPRGRGVCDRGRRRRHRLRAEPPARRESPGPAWFGSAAARRAPNTAPRPRRSPRWAARSCTYRRTSPTRRPCAWGWTPCTRGSARSTGRSTRRSISGTERSRSWTRTTSLAGSRPRSRESPPSPGRSGRSRSASCWSSPPRCPSWRPADRRTTRRRAPSRTPMSRWLDRQHDYPVSVVNWGFWGSVGAVANDRMRAAFARMGVGSVEPAEGMAVLRRIITARLPQTLAMKADRAALPAMGIKLTGTPRDSAPAPDAHAGARGPGGRRGPPVRRLRTGRRGRSAGPRRTVVCRRCVRRGPQVPDRGARPGGDVRELRRGLPREPQHRRPFRAGPRGPAADPALRVHDDPPARRVLPREPRRAARHRPRPGPGPGGPGCRGGLRPRGRAGAAGADDGDTAVFTRARAAFAEVEAFSRDLLLRTFGRLEGMPRPGESVTVDALAARLGVVTRHRRLFDAALSVLRSCGAGRVRRTFAFTEPAASPRSTVDGAEVTARYPEMSGHVILLERTLGALERSSRAAGTRWTSCSRRAPSRWSSPSTRASRSPTTTTGCSPARWPTRPAGSAREGRPARSWRSERAPAPTRTVLLEAAADAEAHYRYTYISPAFLRHGEREFGATYPGLEFSTLDISRDPVEQGIEAVDDVVLGTHVLHATPDVERTLRNIRTPAAAGRPGPRERDHPLLRVPHAHLRPDDRVVDVRGRGAPAAPLTAARSGPVAAQRGGGRAPHGAYRRPAGCACR